MLLRCMRITSKIGLPGPKCDKICNFLLLVIVFLNFSYCGYCVCFFGFIHPCFVYLNVTVFAILHISNRNKFYLRKLENYAPFNEGRWQSFPIVECCKIFTLEFGKKLMSTHSNSSCCDFFQKLCAKSYTNNIFTLG